MKRDNENIKNQLIVGSVFIVILVIALITYLTYSNSDIDELEGKEFSSIGNVNTVYENTEETLENSESASTEMGKTVEESENELENELENKSSSNSGKTTVNNTSTNSKSNTKTTSTNVTKKDKEEKEADEKSTNKEDKEPTLVAPIKGEILREFSTDTLVYSNTLEEWVAHNGIDIKTDESTEVKAAAEGTVYAIKNDPRYGITVIINHSGGYQTVYSNLLNAESVVKGEKVKAGQVIGTVGNTASFEISDECHLHFEVLKNNKNIDPKTCIEF